MTARQKAQAEADARMAAMIPFKDPQLGEYENERIFQQKVAMYMDTLPKTGAMEEKWDQKYGRKTKLQREMKVKPMEYAGGGNAKEIYNQAAYNRQKKSDAYYSTLKPALQRKDLYQRRKEFDRQNKELIAAGRKPIVWGAEKLAAAAEDKEQQEKLALKKERRDVAMRSSMRNRNAELGTFPVRAGMEVCVHEITPEAFERTSSPGAIHRQVARDEEFRENLQARSRMKIVDTMGSEGGTKVLKMAYRSTQLATEMHQFNEDAAAHRKMLAKIARDEKKKAEDMAEITEGLDAARDKRRAKKEALALSKLVKVDAPKGFWGRFKRFLNYFNPCAKPPPTKEDQIVADFGEGALERDEDGNLIDEDGNIVEEIRNEMDFSEVKTEIRAGTMKRARQRMEMQYLATLQAAHDFNKPKTFYDVNDFVSACGDGFYWKVIEILEQVIPPKVQLKDGIYPVQVNEVGVTMKTGFFECFLGALKDDGKRQKARKKKKKKHLDEGGGAAAPEAVIEEPTFKIQWTRMVRALAADDYGIAEEEVTDKMLEKRDFNKLLKELIKRGAKIDAIDESADSNGWTLLQHSAVLENKRRLAWCEEQGMAVDGVDPKGMSALMMCAARGQIKTVLQLLSMGASVDLQDEKGWCALHHATVSGGSKMCKLLLVAGSDKLAVTKEGEMALDLARAAPKSVSQKKIIELLLMYQPQRIPRDEYIRFAGQLVGIDVDASINASVNMDHSLDESSVLTPFTGIGGLTTLGGDTADDFTIATAGTK